MPFFMSGIFHSFTEGGLSRFSRYEDGELLATCLEKAFGDLGCFGGHVHRGR